MFENLKKSQRGGLSPARGRGLFSFLHLADPKLKVYFLLGALVVLVAIMVGLNLYAESKEAQQIAGERVPSPAVGEVAGLAGIPAFDPAIGYRIADEGPDARRRWEDEAIPYLLLEARNTPAVTAYRRNLLPITPGSAAEIEKTSRPWRLKFVRFRGPLEYLREEDYDQTYRPADPPLGRVHRGRVLVASGEQAVRVVFLAPAAPMWSDPNESTPRPEVKFIEDGWVRGRGILVKNYLDATGAESVPALLVVATRIERDYAPVRVETLKDIPFTIINDDPSIATEEAGRLVLAKEYPKALYRLVKYAEPRAGREGAALREQEGLAPQSFDSEKGYEELLGEPWRFRTKYFGGLGAIALEPLPYGPSTITANDAGVDECLNGWILTDKQKLVQFVAPARLAGDWKLRSRIRYEGYFYKTKLYPARNGTDRLAPLLVLTVLEKVPPPVPNLTAQILIAVGFIVGIAALVFIVVREDKTKESYRRLRRKRIAAT
ncbi:MAG: hypothetical protein ACYTEZ_09665 [Planctomycetota bacterium]|jgi:hypothetical protein